MDRAGRPPCIFVVNDDTVFLQLMEQLLTDEGYDAVTLKSSKDAHERIKEAQPALVILDIRLNNEDAGLLLLDLLALDPICWPSTRRPDTSRSSWPARTSVPSPGGTPSSRQRVST